MTKEQFLKPYLLLVFQPWGRRYDLASPEGQTQSEFYYSQLHWAQAEAWMKVATQCAQGEAWPTLQNLKQSLHAINLQYVPRLPAPQGNVMTKEEFGLDLYECIKACASRAQLREMYKHACTQDGVSVEQRKRILADLKQREGICTAQIVSLMPRLGTADQRRLLEQYEGQP